MQPYSIIQLAISCGKLHAKRPEKVDMKLQRLKLEMWANAQRDGRPAVYRWRPVFSAAIWLMPTTIECRAVTLPRRDTR